MDVKQINLFLNIPTGCNSIYDQLITQLVACRNGSDHGYPRLEKGCLLKMDFKKHAEECAETGVFFPAVGETPWHPSPTCNGTYCQESSVISREIWSVEAEIEVSSPFLFTRKSPHFELLPCTARLNRASFLPCESGNCVTFQVKLMEREFAESTSSSTATALFHAFSPCHPMLVVSDFPLGRVVVVFSVLPDRT